MQVTRVVLSLLNFYELLIVVYIIMSWIPGRGWVNDIRHTLASICEPYLSIFRRFIPAAGGLDFSPIIAIIVLNIVGQFIVRLLAGY